MRLQVDELTYALHYLSPRYPVNKECVALLKKKHYAYLHLFTNSPHRSAHTCQHTHGAAHWHHRHGLSWSRGRYRAGCFSHRRHLIHSRVHVRLRLQHRRSNTHGAAQRRGQLSAHRRHILSQHRIPAIVRSRAVCACSSLLTSHIAAHHTIAPCVRGRHHLFALAHHRHVLCLCQRYVPSLLCGHHPHTPSRSTRL